MLYVNCVQCGRPVMTFNTCSYCHTLDQSQRPKSNWPSTSPSRPISRGGLAGLVGLMAAGFAYWKSADETAAIAVGVMAWLFARTSIGHTLVKLALLVIGLGMAWLVWSFFGGLSKTFR